MKPIRASQGKQITTEDIRYIRQVIREHPTWNRTRISEQLCHQWHWIDHNGNLGDMACRTALLKLHRAGHIVLPSPQRPANNDPRNWHFDHINHDTLPIKGPLSQLLPIRGNSASCSNIWYTATTILVTKAVPEKACGILPMTEMGDLSHA